MPTRNALASVRLSYAQRLPTAPYHVTLRIWSHSYDHPTSARRNALVTGVSLTELSPSGGYAVSNVEIKDRYGVDQTRFWRRNSGAAQEGFEGFAEYDTGGACGPALPSVFWIAYSGVYDERCWADQTVDAFRLQSYRNGTAQVALFNYMLGPLTFSFDINLSAPPSAVRLTLGHVGGNGGDPAQHAATLPNEEWVVRFP